MNKMSPLPFRQSFPRDNQKPRVPLLKIINQNTKQQSNEGSLSNDSDNDTVFEYHWNKVDPPKLRTKRLKLFKKKKYYLQLYYFTQLGMSN